MGRVSHFVNRFNWTILPAVALAGGLFALGMSYVRDGLIGMKPTQVQMSVQIDNKGNVKAYEVVNGTLVPVK